MESTRSRAAPTLQFAVPGGRRSARADPEHRVDDGAEGGALAVATAQEYPSPPVTRVAGSTPGPAGSYRDVRRGPGRASRGLALRAHSRSPIERSRRVFTASKIRAFRSWVAYRQTW